MRNNINALIGGLLLMVSCGGDSGSNTPDPPPPVVVTPPSAAALVFPDDNTECNEGIVVNETQSTVTFRWADSENTDSYQVNIRNLDNNNTSRTNSSINSADITILRGVPYEWFVVSRADGTNETATSASWRFYNQGPGVENYAPFPAELVSPARGSTVGATGTITLEWTGSDVDNDIVDFDIYLDTDASPTTLLGTTSDSTLDASITANTVYYWRVVSRDSQGNTSQSEIFEFRVQ